MPNIDAMACGCPVVTTPGFAMREIVGDAALIVDDARDPRALSHAMAHSLTDGPLRARLIENGLRRARLFSWPTSAGRLLAAYEDLLQSSQPEVDAG